MKLIFVGGSNHGRVCDVRGDRWELPIWEPIRIPSPEKLKEPIENIFYRTEMYNRHIIRDKNTSIEFMVLDGWGVIDAISLLLEEAEYRRNNNG